MTYLWDGPQAVDLDDVAGATIFRTLSPFLGRRAAMRHARSALPIARSSTDDGAFHEHDDRWDSPRE